jgi:hypothetical protein
MSVNLKPRRVSVNLPQNDSQAIGGAEGHCPCASCSDTKIPRRQSTEMNQSSLAYETPVKAQSTPDVSLDPKKDNGSVSPATRGEETSDTLIQSRRVNPTGQKQGTLMSWLKTSKNTGYLKADMARDVGADMERELGTDMKRHMEADTKTNSRTATNPASEQVFHVPEAAQCFTFRAPSPLGGASSVVKPALNQDVRPPFNFFKITSSSKPSTPVLLEAAYPVPLGSGTPQHHGASAASSVNPFISKPPAAPSSSYRREAALSIDFSDRNFHSDPSPVHGEEAAPRPSGMFDWNKATPGHLTKVETVKKPLQAEMLVRPAGSDRTQSTSAIRAEKQGTQHPNTQQLLSPLPTASVGYQSPPSTVPSTPLPSIRLGSLDADEDYSESRIYHSASPTGPNVAIPHAGVRTPGSEEDDDFCSSSLPSDKESDFEDDSFALVRSSPSPGRDRESVSSAMIRSPSPGGLNVIWVWKVTERRKKMSQAFFWIVHHLCRDLTKPEIREGYIYAFKVKDPQGRGYVKIGVTRNIKLRMKNHKICYGECERIYPPEGENSVPVDHAYRVERLIHAELVEQAMLLERCPRSRLRHNGHGEWFDVEERHAIAVIRKWSEWMSSSPYEEKLSTGISQKKSPEASAEARWRLRALEHDIVMKICWPLDPLAPTTDDDGIDEVGAGMRLITVS